MAEVSPATKKDGTKFTWEIRKPHPGVIQFVIVFPNGDFYVWRTIEFHDTNKVAKNVGAKGSLPTDWEVTTAAERDADRLAEETAKRLNVERVTKDKV